MSALVRAASLTHYCDVARAAGLDPARMLADAGLSVGALRDPDLQVPAGRVGHLLDASAAASGDESFALRMAASRRVSDLGPLALLLREQPTLRSSLEVLRRYQRRLGNALSMVLEESDSEVVIRVEMSVGGTRPTRQAVELALGVIVRLLRQFLGTAWNPRRVCFVHPAPRDRRAHMHTFGPRIRFGGDIDGIVFARVDLDAHNPAADPAMARHAQALLDAALPPAETTLLEDVRRTVQLLLPGGRCSIEQVASHLGLVCRTVQRRLAERGACFSAVVHDTRRELARRHVTEGDRPLTDVSALLGFAAPSGFSRWYRAEFGCSPRQTRRARPSTAARTAGSGSACGTRPAPARWSA